MAGDLQKNVTNPAQRDTPNASNDTHPPHPQKQNGPPSTASVLWAAWRAGLKDLQNAVLNAFPPSHVAQHEEPGSIANPTQLEVYQEKHNDSPNVAGDELSYQHNLSHFANRPASQGRDPGRDR